MPYIDKKSREKFKDLEMIGLHCESSGELNYCLTMICKGYLNKLGLIKYARINDILGALSGASLEFYRRIAVNYEDSKINSVENGDVY